LQSVLYNTLLYLQTCSFSLEKLYLNPYLLEYGRVP